MLIKAVQFENFRRFEKAEFHFSPNYNILMGSNGVGKTTVLEGLYLLSTGKSFVTNHINNCIRFGSDYAFLSANFNVNAQAGGVPHGYSADRPSADSMPSVNKTLPESTAYEPEFAREFNVRFLLGKNKREVRLNEKKFSGFSPLVGLFPMIFMNYKLSLLVRGGPENRRAFLNHLLIFADKEYYNLIKKYYVLLKNRNASLKQNLDTNLLRLYSEEIVETGKKIQEKRAEIIEKLKPITAEMFFKITGKKAHLFLNYKRSKIENMLSEETIQHEVQHKRTLYGVHLDEMEIVLNDVPAREFSSLGEAYSIGFALRFAENKLIEEIKKDAPVILLDDFFSDLDAYHRKNILDIIKNQQVLLTTLDLSLVPENLIPEVNVLALR
jgi:DNA replication and repair protein RecF